MNADLVPAKRPPSSESAYRLLPSISTIAIYYAFSTKHCRRRHCVLLSRSSGQILLPGYLMNGLNNFDNNWQGIFTSPYWWPYLDSGGQRSRSYLDSSLCRSKGIYVDTGASKSRLLVIIVQPESGYSFTVPLRVEGWLNKVAQPVSKAVCHSGCHDKHSILGSFTPHSCILPLGHWKLQA